MSERFRSLATMLLAQPVPPPVPVIVEPPAEIEQPTHVESEIESDDAQINVLRDVRLFHARIMERIESAVETLIEGIARDVLARELQLAPCDLEAIVDRALARYAADEPLRIRLHPSDVLGLQCSLPVVADEGVRRGDAVIELRSGSVEASLSVRAAGVVRACCA